MWKYTRFFICCLVTITFFDSHVRADGSVFATGNDVPKVFLDAAQAAGDTVASGPDISPDANILVYQAGPRFPDMDKVHAAMEAVLKKGGSVIIFLSTGDKALHSLEDLAPVNFWSAENTRLLRLSTGALAPAGSPFTAVLQTPGFNLAGRFDLHLPYSTTEAGQQRYDWEALGKPLLNTDWQVLLTTDQDGRLPLLIQGRSYAGRVFVLGGDLYAPELSQWSGYADFVGALLKQAAPQAVPDDASVQDLKLAVNSHQPGSGPLSVSIANPGGSEVHAVLAGKVRRLTNGLLNSFSQDVVVPAGQTITVSFPESAPVRDITAAPPSGDSDMPYRRLELGLASPARQEIAAHLDAVVDRTPAVTLQVEGEDVRQFPDSDGWAMGGIEMLNGNGIPLDRYTYFCGQQPKVTIHLANGLHNIAPLAQASDVDWPENISAQGLNDGAFSYDSVRGRYPVTAYWSGRTAPTQHIRLVWPMPVLAAGQQLFAQTDNRNWDRSNPPAYTLTAQGASQTAPLATVQNASYTYGRRTDSFPATTLTGLDLSISGLSEHKQEPEALRGTPAADPAGANCSLGEWEVYGWPDATPPPAVKGHLKVTCIDLSTGEETSLADQDVALDPLTGKDFPFTLPTRQSLGQVRVHAEFTPAQPAEKIAADLPLLFVAESATHLTQRDDPDGYGMGFLCEPGFQALDDFGIGTHDASTGWSGPDNSAWAWSHDLMETGDARNRYYPQRFLLSPVGMSHYTDPWRDFPSGQYVWDWATDRLVDKMTNGPGKGKKTLHVMLADRWNGIPIGAAFTWDDFVRFDEYLRAEGKPGLTGRTRADLCKEIEAQHADEFQRFELQGYADAMSNTQKKLAAAGIGFTSETHGSFPLAGGDLGAQLATVDKAVGTDLFWELRDEDVFKGIGYRLGLVTANPDFQSGAYDQWEWTSGTQQNPTWFSPSGDVEPSRLQWYSTYWKGRVTSAGEFQPYTVFGFSMEGDYGAKDVLDDWIKFNRVQSTMIWVRPEQPAGIGIVASWPLQTRNMTPTSSAFGFGLYASNGYHPDNPQDHSGMHEQIDQSVGEAYYRLVKNGVPIAFVASTDTLKKWKGTQPLVVVNGFAGESWEIAELNRLNRAGTPIVAMGNEPAPENTGSDPLFGVSQDGPGWTPGPGTRVAKDAGGAPFAYICERQGRAPTLFCPADTESLDGPHSVLLAGLIQEVCGKALEVPYGVTASPFVSQGSLFIGFGNLSDSSRMLDMVVRPSALNASFAGTSFRVVDHDRAVEVPSTWKDGALHFSIPVAPDDGRLIQLIPLSAKVTKA